MEQEKIIQEAMQSLGLWITEEKCGQLLRFYEILSEKNKVMNLTAITDFHEVVLKHFVDSAALVQVLDLQERELRVLDLGTGAGFPGIPLKILFPKLHLVLLDSLNKRVKFLNEVIEELSLNDIEAIHGRAEEYGRKKEFREQFDLCVSRAVANLATLSEFCLPFVRMGGYFIPYKSGEMQEELGNAKNAIRLLGGSIEEVKEFVLPNSDIGRSFIKIKKVGNTKPKYPRMGGKPMKEPIL